MDNLVTPLLEQGHIVSIAESVVFPDNIYRETALPTCLSIDNPVSRLCLTAMRIARKALPVYYLLCIDTRFFGAAVAAMLYFLILYRV